MKKLCKVVRTTDKHIYILSNRTEDLQDGQYYMDSIEDIYVVFEGYLLPVIDRGSIPIGEIYRIEASTNKSMRMFRLTPAFLWAVSVARKNKKPIEKAYMEIKKDGLIRVDETAHIMLKAYNNG